MSAPRVQVYAARVVHLPPAQFAGRICAARLMRSRTSAIPTPRRPH